MARLVVLDGSQTEYDELLSGKRNYILRLSLERKLSVFKRGDVARFNNQEELFVITRKIVSDNFILALNSCNLSKLFPNKDKELLIKMFKKRYPRQKNKNWKFVCLKLSHIQMDFLQFDEIAHFVYKPLDIS